MQAALPGRCRVWSAPADRQRASCPVVDVLIYPADRLPFHLLVTVGMSLHEQPTPRAHGEGPDAFVELYSLLAREAAKTDRALNDFASSLWSLAQVPLRHAQVKPYLQAGDVVHGMPPLIYGSWLTAFVLLEPSAEHRPMLHLGSTLRMSMLEAWGMTDRERQAYEQAVVRGGQQTFLQELFKLEGRWTNPTRKGAAQDKLDRIVSSC